MPGISKFAKVTISTQGPPLEARALNIMLFLTDVTKDEVSNWVEGQVTKTYSVNEVGADFPNTTHAYKVASAIFNQTPAVSEFKIGRRDPDQSVSDALDVIENQDSAWYALIGTRGLNDILSAATWIEPRRKRHFLASYDQDIPTTSDSSLAAIMAQTAYERSIFFYNNQAGFTLDPADIALSVADGICSVIVSGGPQTNKVSIDAVVEAFTYTVDIDGEVASHTTSENWLRQINKITILRAVDSFTYRISIACVFKTYVATVPTDTEEDIKNALKIAINADLVLQEKMGAVDDPEDVNSLRLIGQDNNAAYEVLPGENISNTPLTTLTPPTQAEIIAKLQAALLENEIINALVNVTIVNGGETLNISVKDPIDTYVIAVSAKLTEELVIFDYGFKVGDPLIVSGSDDPLQLNGNAFIDKVTDVNKFSFPTFAPDGVPTGTIAIDVKFTYPDAALAGMGLAFANGSLDWAHQDIVAVVPETDQHLTVDVQNNLEANNANYFHVTAGKRLFWPGKALDGTFIDIGIDGIDYLTTRMEESIFDFITSQPKTPMSDASLGALKNAMDRTLEQEGRVRGITAPFIEDRVKFPETGFPAGARPGDHYVSRVPRIQDIPINDRQNRQITFGVEFEFQTSGGIHVIAAQGTLHQ